MEEAGKSKSLFLTAHSEKGGSDSLLYEVKIQPGGQVSAGRGSIRRKPCSCRCHDALLLKPVKEARLPEHSHLTTASRSKLYFWPNTSSSEPPCGHVFDTKTMAMVSINSSPQAHKPYATIVAAYSKLYHIATNPHGWPEMPSPVFERYDPATNCWESLPPCPVVPRKVLGYAVCNGVILFSIGFYFMAFDVTRKQWHVVVQQSSSEEYHELSGRAVVVGDIIYTHRTSSNSVVAFKFWKDLDEEGDVTFYISLQPDLEGLHINKAYSKDARQGYLIHLGDSEFCLVLNRLRKIRAEPPDGHHKLCITTFQVVECSGGRQIIKTLHSTICEVDSRISLGFCIGPDCDHDIECTEAEEMRVLKKHGDLANNVPWDIPQDVIFDILARLSTKDLIRLMCVSKAWNAAIQDPSFAKVHLQLSIKRSALEPTFLALSHDSHHTDEVVSVTLLDNGKKAVFESVKQHSEQIKQRNKILGYSNGLVCIYGSLEKEDFGLWNPTFRKFKKIPLSAFSKWTQLTKTFYGFGYDSVNDDYKFVRMAQFKNCSSEVQVYSLKFHSWKRVQDLPAHLNDAYILASNGVCLDTTLHWLMKLGDQDGGQMIVLTFDLASEEYHWFSSPDHTRLIGSRINNLHLHVIGGFLCFCFHKGFRCETWILKEYGVIKSWTKLCSYDKDLYFGNPLIFSKCGNKVFLVRMGQLCWYRLDDATTEEICYNGPMRWISHMVISIGTLHLLQRRLELPRNNCY